MLGLFKKGKPTPIAKIAVPASVLTKEAKEYDLAMSVISWFNKVQHQGGYLMSEMPPAAPQTYHADYYLAQINNGGHAQFALNSGMNPVTIFWALEGLKATGQTELYTCLDELSKMNLKIQTMEAYHALVASGKVKHLDDKFFAHSKNFYKAFNVHLQHSIMPIPDDQYERHMASLIALDDVRLARMQSLRMLSNEGALLNAHQLASNIGMLALGSVVHIHGNGSYVRFLGCVLSQMTLFTRDKQKGYIINDPETEAYYVTRMPIAYGQDPETLMQIFSQMVRVQYSRVASEIDITKTKRYGRVLAWALKETGLDTDVHSITPLIDNAQSCAKGEPAKYLVAHKDHLLVFEITDDAYTLSKQNDNLGNSLTPLMKGKSQASLKLAKDFSDKAFPNQP